LLNIFWSATYSSSLHHLTLITIAYAVRPALTLVTDDDGDDDDALCLTFCSLPL